MKKKSKQQNRKTLHILLVGIILLVSVTVFCGIYRLLAAPKTVTASARVQKQLLSDVTRSDVVITSFYIYGNHLHLEGALPLEQNTDFQSLGLVLRREDGNEKEIALQHEQSNRLISFTSSSSINGGICPDELTAGSYCVLFKLRTAGGTEYLSAESQRDFDTLRYYTVSKNNENRRVDLGFTDYSNSEKNLHCLALNVKKAKLPRDVYDIVLDPGHGGNDPGAEGFGYTEAQLTLPFAQKLKESLENLGLKVKLTRDGTEAPNSTTSAAAYDKDGRVERTCSSGAKYCLSLHLNSSETENDPSNGGVEIYCAEGVNTDFAARMANNLVKTAHTTYSEHGFCRVANGVYMRTYNQSDIAESRRMAAEMGYKPYPTQGTNTTYYYMIREPGGVATGAYIDGRSPEFKDSATGENSKNEYYDSLIGIESYLVELGYICVEQDISNIIYNEDLYVQALTDAFAAEVGLK